jgi:hypothetical protein
MQAQLKYGKCNNCTCTNSLIKQLSKPGSKLRTIFLSVAELFITLPLPQVVVMVELKVYQIILAVE